MSLHLLQIRFKKLFFLLRYPKLIGAFIRYRLFAAVEHAAIIGSQFSTIVDIGANRGQFTLACRALSPASKIISFEPLPMASAKFAEFFKDDQSVKLYNAAIGPIQGQELMHVSAKDDSSSLLPMSGEQVKAFPGTQEIGTIHVDVAPLEHFLKLSDISSPALLKIDVQGYEYEVLLGCDSVISSFSHVYCECSFVELYTGQKLVDSIADWLYQRGFRLAGVYNICYAKSGMAIQADFMFERVSSSLPG
jgi:FkbM family methyltransferase